MGGGRHPLLALLALGSNIGDLVEGVAGAVLASRPVSFISMAWDRFMAAVPTAPAASPMPTLAAVLPKRASMRILLW
ncbi:MAG: hypothetical protein M3349_05530 [Actinomycetota bacterium]|nr:hypothetical protein [Actinomycetota bacterium]